eukprot:2118800-Amphidinium_carterae.1
MDPHEDADDHGTMMRYSLRDLRCLKVDLRTMLVRPAYFRGGSVAAAVGLCGKTKSSGMNRKSIKPDLDPQTQLRPQS